MARWWKRTCMAAVMRSSDGRPDSLIMDSASLRFFKVGCFQVASLKTTNLGSSWIKLDQVGSSSPTETKM